MLYGIHIGDSHDQEQDSEYDTRIVSTRESIQDIAMTLGIARNTVRKYVRHPELVAIPHPRPNRRSKLDPFKEQVKQFHDLRHSSATMLLSIGVHPKVVQKLLGHSQISMTMDIYSHVLPTMQQEAISKLNTVLEG